MTLERYLDYQLLGHNAAMRYACDPDYSPAIPAEGEECEAWMDGWRNAQDLSRYGAALRRFVEAVRAHG